MTFVAYSLNFHVKENSFTLILREEKKIEVELKCSHKYTGVVIEKKM